MENQHNNSTKNKTPYFGSLMIYMYHFTIPK